MTDLTTELRRACLTQMKGDAGLLAVVPKGSIYTTVVPIGASWPFVKWGLPSGVPITATCLNGETIDITVHGFARARKSGAQTVETGEDHIGRLAGAIKGALHQRRLTIPSGYATLRWVGGQRLIDGDEADDWHAACQFRARVIAS